MKSRLHRTLELIDAANAADPRMESSEGGVHPKEWLYGRRMSEWLGRLCPHASETLQIAVRAQHLCRWEKPRSEYPEGRAGYLRWRSALYSFHADRAADLMRETGYEREAIDRVRALLSKRLIKSDSEAATLEDVACLVFLEFYLVGFAPDQDREKMVSILRKSWAKMSPAGRDAATQIEFSPQVQELLEEALATS